MYLADGYFDPRVNRWLSEATDGLSTGDVNPYRLLGNAPAGAPITSGGQSRQAAMSERSQVREALISAMTPTPRDANILPQGLQSPSFVSDPWGPFKGVRNR